MLMSVRCSEALQSFCSCRVLVVVMGQHHAVEAQVQRSAAMSGDLTKPEDVVPFIVFLATDGAPPFDFILST